jgi:hypothetical protein
MSYMDELYSELKPDIEAVASALFDLSELFLEKNGNFLPHGAVLTAEGEVRLVAAAPDTKRDYADSTEILPILHEGLRSQIAEDSIRAVGVAENVTITPSGQKSTKAIKVLFEHQRGLTTALYLPFDKTLFKSYTFGNIFSVSAQPEINAWQ